MKLRLRCIDRFLVGLEGSTPVAVRSKLATAPALRAAPSGRKLEQTLNVVTGSDFALFVHPWLGQRWSCDRNCCAFDGGFHYGRQL